MNMMKNRLREQSSQIILLLMFVVIIVLLIQLWLITIALEDYLAARTALAVPTFAASGVCLAANLVVLRFLYVVDSHSRER